MKHGRSNKPEIRDKTPPIKIIRYDTRHQRFAPGRGKRSEISKLQQKHCMNNRGKFTFCIGNSNKAYISIVLANLMQDKVKKNHVLRVETKNK